MVYSLGPMVVNMKGNGRMENNMALEHITQVKVKLRKVSGLMVKELLGLMNDSSIKCVKKQQVLRISFKFFPELKTLLISYRILIALYL